LKKKILRIFIGIFVILLLVFLLFNSAPGITREDETYLTAFLKEWNITLDKKKVHQDQQSEIAYISRVQDSVLNTIQHFTIPFDSAGNVQCYFTTRKGLCFDRALLLEKFCQLAGFNVRHLYIYFNGKGQKPERSDLFHKNLNSHAMFEVETKEGWMAVGTNCNWLGLDQQGHPMTLGMIRTKLEQLSLALSKPFTVGRPFYDELENKGAFRFVYGVYSRHGQFLKSQPLETLLNSVGIKSRIPDYNISMLFANF